MGYEVVNQLRTHVKQEDNKQIKATKIWALETPPLPTFPS